MKKKTLAAVVAASLSAGAGIAEVGRNIAATTGWKVHHVDLRSGVDGKVARAAVAAHRAPEEGVVLGKCDDSEPMAQAAMRKVVELSESGCTFSR